MVRSKRSAELYEVLYGSLTQSFIILRALDPLESEETLLISLEAFANIVRTKYAESGQLIIAEVRALSQKYQELIQRASSLTGSSAPPVGSSDLKEQLLVVEMQLTWMVYVIGACIGGRVVSRMVICCYYDFCMHAILLN